MERMSVISRALVAGVFTALVGCGSASNDQGVSFALLGFTSITTSSTEGSISCATSDFDNGVVIPIGDSTEAPATGLTTRRCVRLQNNLSAQAIRVERVKLSYFIAGANEQPPSTTVPITMTLGAVSSSGSTTSGSSSSGGLTSLPNSAVGPIDMVPPEVRSWITLNRGSLPEAPFSMDIVAAAVGVTSAGDQLVSNEGYYQAQVTNDVVINPDTGGGTSSSESITEPITDGTTGTTDGTSDGTTDVITGQ